MSCLTTCTACGRRTEKGAATLVAVLFLLIVIAFAVLVATSMSSSDITDTSVQQSGVNALLLAESGLERASGRFISGISCANLAVDGPYGLGAGSFTINATYTTDFSGATLPADECRVQSVGTVGNVQRTLQGILQLPSGMVVGNRGVAYQCRTSGCTATPSTGTNNQNLMDVSCASAASCMAVGTGGTAIQWNGASWSPANSGISSTDALNAVVCQPGNGSNCYAGGSDTANGKGVFLQWDGTTNQWNTLSLPNSFPLITSITDLTCPVFGGSVTCYVIATAGVNSVIYQYTNNAWSNSLYSTIHTLNGINCYSSSLCWAVGNKIGNGANSQMNIVGTTGGSWGTPPLSFYSSQIASLDDVACADANDCWAIGFKNANYAFWNGSSWSHVTVATNNNRLLGIDCPSSSACWTVGASGTVNLGSFIASWKWSTVTLTPVTTQTLNAVSFPVGSGGNGGSVVLIQWHEVVS